MFSVYLNYFSLIENIVNEYNRIHNNYFRIEYLDINSLSGIVEVEYKDFCVSILESSEELRDSPEEVKRIILQKSYLNPEELLKEALRLVHQTKYDTTSIPTPPAYENLLDRIQKMEESLKKKEEYEQILMAKTTSENIKSKIENIFEKHFYPEASSASTEDLAKDR